MTTTTSISRMYSYESLITTEPSIHDVIQTRLVSPLAPARVIVFPPSRKK